MGDSRQIRRVLRTLRAAGVRVVTDNDIPYPAGVSLDEGGYTLRLTDEYHAMPPRHQLAILCHELAHINRGDCLVMANDDIDALVWNIASDSTINESLDKTVVSELPVVLYHRDIAPRFQELPQHYAPATARIYEVLKEHGWSGDAQRGPLDQLEAKGDLDKLRREHIRQVLRLREAAKSSKELQEALDKAGGVTVIERRTLTVIKPIPHPPASEALKRLRQAVRGASGVRVRRRTWARPGRVPGLRGVVRERRAKVMLAVDVSGSMEAVKDVSLGVAWWAAREMAVELYAFADAVAYISRGTAAIGALSSGISADVGWGTQLLPVFRRAEVERPDVLMMVTDNFSWDWTMNDLPPCPIVWCITPGGDDPMLRDIDTMTRIAE